MANRLRSVRLPVTTRRLRSSSARVESSLRGPCSRVHASTPHKDRRVESVDLVRRGKHLRETIIMVGVAALTALLVLPRFSVLAERNQLTVAREELTSAIATARQAAIRGGRTATLFLSANRLWVTAELPNASTTTVVPVQSFKALYNVSVAASDPSLMTVTFDRRGFATPRLATIGVFRIRGATRADSVCVTRAGHVLRGNCQALTTGQRVSTSTP